MNNTMREYRPDRYTAGNVQKRAIYPAQSNTRRIAPRPYHGTVKRISITTRVVQFCRRVYWGRVAILCLCVLGVYFLVSTAVGLIIGEREAPAEIETPAEPYTITVKTAPVEYVFRDGEGHPVDMQATTDAYAQEAGLVKRYDLTDAERWEVASVVTAEAAGEPFAGKMAVAQCILQACEDDGIRPTEAVVKYKYAKNRPEPTAEVLEAVQAVFDLGQVVTTEPIKYFYAKAIVSSDFHESQDFVIEINGHRFFAEVKR